MGSFCVLGGQINTITIHEDGTTNIVSIDMLADELSITNWTQRLNPTAQPEPDTTENNTPSEARNNHMVKGENVVERIGRHFGKGDTLRCVVSGYYYRPNEDTVEPA